MPELSKSKNRSIIGTAVDFEQLTKTFLTQYEIESRDVTQTEMSLKLSRVPILVMKPESFPYRAFSEELKKRYGKTGKFAHEMPRARVETLH